MITDHYELTPTLAVRFCCWCTPAAELLQRFPHLRGRKLLLTICHRHENEQAVLSQRACAILYHAHTETG